MKMRGPLGVAGLLTLSSQVLRFEPTGRLDKLIGERNLAIKTQTITKVTLAGIERTLTVFSSKKGGREYKFAGRGAARLHLRLESMLEQRVGNTALLPSGEKPILESSATLYNNNLIATRGDLVLTNKRFFFTPRGGLETHIWSFPVINVPLSQIQQIKLSEVKKLLEIFIDGERHLFGGPIVEKLNQELCALGLDIREAATPKAILNEDDIEIKCSHHQGVIPTPGLARMTKGELSFTPKGRMATMLGAATHSIKITSIKKMEILGAKKLAIETDKEEMTLGLTKPMVTLIQLIDRITSCLNRELQSLEEESGGFEQLLTLWEEELHLTLGEPIVLTAPSIFWHNENTAICGWIALTDTRVFFLPLNGPDESSNLISIDLTTINPSMESKERSETDIFLETHKSTLKFTPLTAKGFVEAFWILSEPIITEEVSLPDHFKIARANKAVVRSGNTENSEDSSDEFAVGSPSIRPLIGELLSMTLHRGENPIMIISPAETSIQGEGLSVLIDNSTCIWFEEGEPLFVQITKTEGTYNFHTTVIDVQKHQPAEKKDNATKMKLLLLRKPRTLKFKERRLKPRAVYPPLSNGCTVDVTGLPGFSANKIKGYLQNLSSDGCSIQLSSFIPERLTIILKLQLGSIETSVSAVCHHTSPPNPIGGSWVFGMKFTNNSAEEQFIIDTEIAKNGQY